MKKPFNVNEFIRKHVIIKVDGGRFILPFVKVKPPVFKSGVNKLKEDK